MKVKDLDKYMQSMLQWAESVTKVNIEKAQNKQKEYCNAEHKLPTKYGGTTPEKILVKEESWSTTGMVHTKLLSKQLEEHTT